MANAAKLIGRVEHWLFTIQYAERCMVTDDFDAAPAFIIATV